MPAPGRGDHSAIRRCALTRILVLGQSHVAARLGELARRLGLCAALAPLGPLDARVKAAWEGLEILEGEAEDPELLRRLDPASARAAICCAHDDADNLAAALWLRDARPDLRLVVSFFNPAMGRQIEKELGDCAVLSSAEISAPCFAAAALDPRARFTLALEGRLYSLMGSAEDCRVVETETLAPEASTAQEARRALPRPARARRGPDRYLAGILGLITAVLATATLYFHVSQGMPWLSALYFVVTTFCTVGYGDYSLKDASPLAQTAGIVLMLSSVTLTAALFAILTNALVQKRSDILEGRRRYRLDGHVLVCGAGIVGLRVAQCLQSLGLRPLVIEKDRENPLLRELASQGIPYMVQDATGERAMLDAGLHRARALVCAMNDDLLGLEIGLGARALRPGVHLVVRIFDGLLAERVQRHFHIRTALSTSAIAAPAFLARALHPDALTLFEEDGAWRILSSPRDGAPTKPGETALLEGAAGLTLSPIAAILGVPVGSAASLPHLSGAPHA